jgi:ketosteroid isomerase-like protein
MSARIVLSALVLAATLASSMPAAADDDTVAITTLLTRSARYWNHGDLDAFMRSYENAPTTVYVSSKRVIHGYANIRAHYAEHYGVGTMPALSISDIAVRPLGERYAVVVARWHLAMHDGTHPTGIFTLVLHRTDGWHIITDHSP